MFSQINHQSACIPAYIHSLKYSEKKPAFAYNPFLFIIGSMVISYSIFTAPIPIRRPAPNRLLVMRAHNQISINGNPLPIRSFPKNKVFEDLSAGIVCYRDKNGEITCEGFDEGPRFHQQLISRFTCNSRDIEIVELLQRCWDGFK